MLQTSSQHMEGEGILWCTNNQLSQQQLPQTVSINLQDRKGAWEWKTERMQKNPT